MIKPVALLCPPPTINVAVDLPTASQSVGKLRSCHSTCNALSIVSKNRQRDTPSCYPGEGLQVWTTSRAEKVSQSTSPRTDNATDYRGFDKDVFKEWWAMLLTTVVTSGMRMGMQTAAEPCCASMEVSKREKGCRFSGQPVVFEKGQRCSAPRSAVAHLPGRHA